LCQEGFVHAKEMGCDHVFATCRNDGTERLTYRCKKKALHLVVRDFLFIIVRRVNGKINL
jgi:hypothetical protein